MSDHPVVTGAPAEIWLCVGDISDCEGEVPFRELERAGDIGWCAEQIDRSDVRYVRADLVPLPEPPK